ncbi:hypothetical protein [Fundidesulfovibrio terrae]|uniref:hypothetical protein n=1 Tax=Fundidesulfovibrio terrae TaxID=2922866 RepID=UPI001FAFF595|nr:hypothetical protein [Fundidesulfovibrio terrae]
MSKSPDDIIELTDIIEHGPNASKQEGAEGGVDLSFERELEDLFAEAPDSKTEAPAPDIPGLDDLHLPGDEPKAGGEGDIDLDGLDALLADAEKNQPGGLDLPELPDDFLGETVAAAPPQAAPEAAPAVVSDQAAEALSARLDALEDKLSTMGNTLAASFKAMLDEAVSGIKADIPAPAEAAADPAPLIAELRESLEARIEALQAGLPAAMDEDALASRIKDEILAALPEPAAPDEEALAQRIRQDILSSLPEPAAMDEEALAARVKDDVLAALPQPEISTEAAPAVDVEALAAQVEARLDERLDALKAELSTGAAAGADPAPMIEEASARLQGAIDAVQNRIDAVPADMSSMLDEMAARTGQRLDELEARIPSGDSPDVSALASRDELAQLRQDLLAEMKKAVPAAAAQIIREEIQALLQDAD